MLGGWRHGSATAQRKDTVEILEHIKHDVAFQPPEFRSPYFSKYSGIRIPASCSISLSASANGRFIICATSLPTRVLPAPIMPMITATGYAYHS